MAQFLFLSQTLPVGLDVFRFLLPLFPDDFGYLGVGKIGVLRDNLGLVVLTIEDECCHGVSFHKHDLSWR